MDAIAIRSSSAGSSRRGRAITLRVQDVSPGGVGVVSSEALEPSEELVFFIPPRGGCLGRDLRGSVTRCEDLGGTYSAGVAFREAWPYDAAEPD